MSSYDDLADRLQARFQTFATAVAGERALASAAGVMPGSAKQWYRFKDFKKAHQADAWNDLSFYVKDHLGAASDLFRDRAMERLTFTTLRLAHIDTQIIATSNREGKTNLLDIMRGSGSIGVLAQRRLVQPTFEVKDTSGRRWEASKLVRTIVRDFAYQTFIDSQFDAALADGASEVFLEHNDADHELHGASVDLTAEDWLAQRDDLFHVNSNLTLRYGSVPA